MKATLILEDGTTYTQRSPENEMKPVIGTLKFSEVTVEQSTGAVTIRAEFPNPESTLLPGMFVRAVLEEGVSEHAILIPQKAVTRNNRGLPMVYKLTRDAGPQEQQSQAPADVYTVTLQMISVDRSIDNQWLVTDGLKAGDLVVVEGVMRVRPGASVKGLPETVAPARK